MSQLYSQSAVEIIRDLEKHLFTINLLVTRGFSETQLSISPAICKGPEVETLAAA